MKRPVPFTIEEIAKIRSLEGTTVARTVAQMYGVTTETIRKIWRRDTYTNTSTAPAVLQDDDHSNIMSGLERLQKEGLIATRGDRLVEELKGEPNA